MENFYFKKSKLSAAKKLILYTGKLSSEGCTRYPDVYLHKATNQEYMYFPAKSKIINTLKNYNKPLKLLSF